MKVELKASQAERAAQLQKPSKGYFFFGNKEYPRVKWWTRPNMRKLYFYCFGKCTRISLAMNISS